MFDEWKNSSGSGATYLKLAEALYERHRVDIVEMLCNLCRTSHETTPTEVNAALPDVQPIAQDVQAATGM